MFNYKSILRDAARRARDIILQNDSLPESADCILTSCSRAVFRNDVDQARFSIHKYSLAREVLFIRDDRVCMHNAEDFSLKLSRTRHKCLSSEVRNIESELNRRPKAKLRQRMSFVSNIRRQWVPISRFCLFVQ